MAELKVPAELTDLLLRILGPEGNVEAQGSIGPESRYKYGSIHGTLLNLHHITKPARLLGADFLKCDQALGKVANCNWLPDDLVAALGAGTQRLYISPSLKLVVVRQANDRSGGFQDLEFLSLLLRNLKVKEPGSG